MIHMRFNNSDAMVMSITDAPLIDIVNGTDPTVELPVVVDTIGVMHAIENNVATYGYHIDRDECGFDLYAPTLPTAYLHLGEILCKQYCNNS